MSRFVSLRPLLLQISAWSAVLSGSWLLCLMLMQLLFGRELNRLQTLQLGRALALNIRLTELTLERYPPSLIKEFTGLDLIIAGQPPGSEQQALPNDHRRRELRQELCSRLSHCPMLLPATSGGTAGIQQGGQQIWIELISPLEPVWLRSEIPATRRWPPDPMLMVIALVGAVILTGVVYLLKEVEQPLRGLEKALARVSEGNEPSALPAKGAPEVQRITRRFNSMVQRLAANRRERATMLAGIAHDLRAPITRLQFRLALPSLDDNERDRSRHDLESLERITGQFLLYAGGGERETPVLCPLDLWLAEVVASYPSEQLQLEPSAVQAHIRPVALGRAVSNLIDNAFTYGRPPVVIRLLKHRNRISLEVWDQGSGVPKDQWNRALQPFQRLDDARGQQGHCGLGLAIVNHVMQHHGGTVTFRTGTTNPGRFAVVLNLPEEGLGDDELFRNPDFETTS